MQAATNQPGMAAVAVLGGMFTLGLTDNFVPFVSVEGSLGQFHIVRSLMALVLLWLAAAVWGGSLWPRQVGRVMARNLFSAGAIMIYFGCLALMPIGIVVAGLYTAPIFVLVIRGLVQRQRIGPWRVLAALVGFAGTLLVIQPDPAAPDPLMFLPVLAGLLYAIGAVATRAWCEGEETAAISAGFFVMLVAMGLVAVVALDWIGVTAPEGAAGFPLRTWTPLTWERTGWIGVQAVGGLVGNFLIFRGYQWGEASRVAIFEYSLLIFASLWALVIWGQGLNAVASLGMGLIIASGAVIALRSDTA